MVALGLSPGGSSGKGPHGHIWELGSSGRTYRLDNVLGARATMMSRDKVLVEASVVGLAPLGIPTAVVFT